VKSRLTLFLFLVSSALFACAPFFPVSYLATDTPRWPDNERAYALELLGRHFYPEEWNGKFSIQEGLSTPEATRADFFAAGAGLPAPELDAAWKRYFAFDAACRSGKGAPQYEIAAIPPRFREFYLYSAGFAELDRCGDGRIPEAWARLSALPEAERKYRTTWVLYMSGNLCRNADDRFAFYRKLRHAAQSGFADSSNLAKRSLDRVWKTARTPEEELRYLPADPAVCWNSFMIRHLGKLTAAAWKHDKRRVCSDPLLCEIALLVLGPREVLQELPPDCRPLVAERLAMHCYFDNDIDGCRMLLPQIPEESLIRLYLEARFARRNGDTALAATKLSQWLAAYREEKRRPEPPHLFSADDSNLWMEYSETPKDGIGLPEEVNGILGTVLVRQNDFLEALHAFLAARCWHDAAVVAEQLLPTATLMEYCRNHAPADSKDEMLLRLRHLLARKLMRENRIMEAGEFFPEAYRPLYESYCKTSIAANAAEQPKAERASALFQLGHILYRNGMELRGTELEPDQAIVDGNFPALPSQNWRRGQFPAGFEWNFYEPPAAPNVLAEYPLQPVHTEITRRFHYRGIAADYFARAGTLADDPELKAAGFWAAGVCLKARYPDQANLFYQMLCDQPGTPMAEEARKEKWFPENPVLYELLFRSPLEPAPTREEIIRAAKGEK